MIATDDTSIRKSWGEVTHQVDVNVLHIWATRKLGGSWEMNNSIVMLQMVISSHRMYCQKKPNTSVGLMELCKILILTLARVARAIRDDLNLKTRDGEVSQSHTRTRCWTYHQPMGNGPQMNYPAPAAPCSTYKRQPSADHRQSSLQESLIQMDQFINSWNPIWNLFNYHIYHI